MKRTVKQKKKQYLEEKQSENIAKPKEICQTLKTVVLPNKKNSPSNICLQNKNDLSFAHCQQRKLLKNITPH